VGLKLTMTCGLYDRSRPFLDGTVKPEGIDLEVQVNSNDRSRQSQARAGKFDVRSFLPGFTLPTCNTGS